MITTVLSILRSRYAHGKIGIAGMLGFIGLVSAVVGLAIIPDANGVIHGCYNKSDKKIRIIDFPEETCKADEEAVAWVKNGPTGPQGPRGQAGTPGPQGTIGPAGATGATGSQGSAGPQGPRGPSGSAVISEAYTARGVAATAVGTSGSDVVTKSVPAGNYIVFATVYLQNGDGDPQTATCELRVNGTQVNFAIHAFAGSGSADRGTVAIKERVSISNTSTLTVNCRGFSINHPGFITRLSAIKVNSIS